VKLHGARIELGAIEAILRQHPAVQACLVVACEDEPGEKRLAAYIVGIQTSPTSEALRMHVLQTLLLLPNGQVDRQPCPPDRQREAMAPGSPNVFPRQSAHILEFSPS
jgi:acyl-CoA synthetase (AMP-forming)/AMP-acid ligase II